MNAADYRYIQDFIKQHSGIVLAEGKEYLLESRLMPLVRANELENISNLVTAMNNGANMPLCEAVIDAMTTNESFFFRDKTPFNHFKEIMAPALHQARGANRKLRIWCAAASSGQEPYSLAMCIDEMSALFAGWRIDIVATDLSKQILQKATAGKYSQFEVQRGLPIQMLVKHFTETEESWQISAELRNKIEFKALNLLNDFSHLGRFDIVFCRNVLIYFDEATKRDILSRLAGTLAPDGFLVLGAAETVIGLSDDFKRRPNDAGLYVLDNELGSRQATSMTG